ncbi:hypothetical protein HanPI659440_Chr11g0418991 [Helianthus annuus]|nr:hypothetical protein HanPI659440_Chr11g0418991 [Helianthus annuus]
MRLEFMGRLRGLSLLKRRIKEGRIFGFVSFKGVRDLEDLLAKVKLGGNKLVINMARFAKENGLPKFADDKGGKGGLVKTMGTGKSNVQMGNSHLKGLKSFKNGVSFLDVLTNKTHEEKEDDVLVLDPSVFSLASCFGRGVVGRTLGFQELRFLKASLMEARFGGASIQYLGGLSVLIVFDSEDLTSKLLNEKEIWGRWFSLLHPWLGQALPY